MYKKYFVTGSKQAVSELGENAIGIRIFETEKELEAFCEGIEVASGWSEVELFDTEEEAEDYVKEITNE